MEQHTVAFNIEQFHSVCLLTRNQQFFRLVSTIQEYIKNIPNISHVKFVDENNFELIELLIEQQGKWFEIYKLQPMSASQEAAND